MSDDEDELFSHNAKTDDDERRRFPTMGKRGLVSDNLKQASVFRQSENGIPVSHFGKATETHQSAVRSCAYAASEDGLRKVQGHSQGPSLTVG
jgi:hypothetical protein